MSPLAKIVPFSQQFLAEVLRPGDLAIDLTAGNGHDTLQMWRAVGRDGTVIAFDLQEGALAQTARRLADAGVDCCRHSSPPEQWSSGLHLVHAGHERLQLFVNSAPRAIIANLGYLPGSDKKVITTPESTLAALDQGGELLAPGGRIAVVVYTGHSGGAEEAEAVENWFAALDGSTWETLRLSVANRADSPFLLVAEKK
ncbi:MAG: rRNA methyltransferase [Desulfuromonas sp.]|nr:MAG: rRNA methyltransferase [Desulfuromonas sp.]